MRRFSDSKFSCLKDYVKPLICDNNPDNIIFHIGTNDVPSEKTPEVIAQLMVDITKNVANDSSR